MMEYGTQQDWNFLFGLVAIQATIWGWLYSRNGPLRGAMHNWLERPGHQEKRDILKANGMDEKEWSFWMIVCLHHSLGGFIALIGLLLQPTNIELSVLLVRVGVSCEIGENVLHFGQMAWTYFCPPGSELFGEMFTACMFWVGMCFHHSIGFIAGSFVFLYIPNWWEAQFVVVLLLLAAVPTISQFPFLPHVDMKSRQVPCLGKFVAAQMLLGQLASLLVRLLVFPPVAWSLFQRVQQIYGNEVAMIMGGTIVLFIIFSIAGVAMAWGDLSNAWRQLRGQGQEGENDTALAYAMAAASTSFTLTKSQRSQQKKRELLEMSKDASPELGTAS